MRTGVNGDPAKSISENLELTTAKGRDSVSDALAYLTSSNVGNFYARVLNSLDRYSVPGFGTMGVTVKDGKYILIYDPLFAAEVSYEEVCATCEHEVLHLVLEHIPRYFQLKRLFGSDYADQLMELCANLSMDAAANELLAEAWPGVKDQDTKPLGGWVLPEGYDPPMPPKLSFEGYQELMMDYMRKRLKSKPRDLMELAQGLLQEQMDAVKDAISGGEGNQEGAGGGEGESEGAGSKPGSGNTPSQSELQDQANNLNSVDQKILEQLLSSMKKHNVWEMTANEENEAESHQLSEHGKQVLKETVKSTPEKSRGLIPSHMMELIRELLSPPVVSWAQFFQEVIQRTKQTKKKRGMSKPSKVLSAMKLWAKRTLAKYEAEEEELTPTQLRLQKSLQLMRRTTVFPGVKLDKKYTVIFAVDTSGSMGTSELERAMAELQHVQKSDPDMRVGVIYADSQISKVYWVSASDELDFGLTGRGGTHFDPVFKYIAEELVGHQENSPDLLVYATDGYAPPPTIRLPFPTVWLITPRGIPCCDEAGHITIEMRDYKLGESYA
jgi:predicted metal-dependent peptidase